MYDESDIYEDLELLNKNNHLAQKLNFQIFHFNSTIWCRLISKEEHKQTTRHVTKKIS